MNSAINWSQSTAKAARFEMPNIAASRPVHDDIERARAGNVRKIKTAVSGTSASNWKPVPSPGGSFEIQWNV